MCILLSYIQSLPKLSLLYGVLAEQRVLKCLSVVLALDVRENNEFRTGIINIDVLLTHFYPDVKVDRPRSL